jgi:hypothetical protein
VSESGKEFIPTRPENRDPALPRFDPTESPLRPGGRPVEKSDTLESFADGFAGLLDFPSDPHPRRALYRVRRAGWVAARNAARSRFGTLLETGGVRPATRIVDKLVARGGLLQRARDQAVHPRFNLRGKR